MTSPAPLPLPALELRLSDDQMTELAATIAQMVLAQVLPVVAALPVPPSYYTAAEAAALLKTTPQTISTLRKSGALACLPIGPREYRISQSAIDALEGAL